VTDLKAQPATYSDIPGWFIPDDRALFDLLLEAQGEHGDIVELGAYLGRSAVIIGTHVRPDERFVVVDLFGEEAHVADDGANQAENKRHYATLTRTQFEANYLALHDHLPDIVQAPSSAVLDYVAAGSVRFLHVDASHLYSQVRIDTLNARKLLQRDGVVVFDDYRGLQTPGVAAATWEAVAADGMIPFALTLSKMYATWGDPAYYIEVIRRFVADDKRLRCDEREVHGHTVLLVQYRRNSRPSEANQLRKEIESLRLERAADAKRHQAQLATLRPPRKPLRTIKRQDIPRPLRPIATTVWHALPAKARARIRPPRGKK
jgi:Methyltransferase domain